MSGCAMLVRQRPVVATKVTRTDWEEAVPNVETCTIEVTMSNHVVRRFPVRVVYQYREREQVVEATFAGKECFEDADERRFNTTMAARALAAKRWHAVKQAYREIELLVGSLPRTERV